MITSLMWSVKKQKSAFTVFLLLKMRRRTPITCYLKADVFNF